jgi:ParB family transcriptional regulator, chromosome partitioning protein
MSQLATPEIDIDKIDVEDGFNARRSMSEKGLDQLGTTIAKAGIVQPIAVRPKEDGRFAVVAGHRRLEAAKRQGLIAVPITLSKGNAASTR